MCFRDADSVTKSVRQSVVPSSAVESPTISRAALPTASLPSTTAHSGIYVL